MNLLEVISRVEIEGKNIPAMLKCIVIDDRLAQETLNELNENYSTLFVDIMSSFVYEWELVSCDAYGGDEIGASALELIEEAFAEEPEGAREKHIDNVVRLLYVLLNTDVQMLTVSSDKIIVR